MSSHHFILFLYLTYHVIMFFKATLGGLSEHIGTHSQGGVKDVWVAVHAFFFLFAQVFFNWLCACLWAQVLPQNGWRRRSGWTVRCRIEARRTKSHGSPSSLSSGRRGLNSTRVARPLPCIRPIPGGIPSYGAAVFACRFNLSYWPGRLRRTLSGCASVSTFESVPDSAPFCEA